MNVKVTMGNTTYIYVVSTGFYYEADHYDPENWTEIDSTDVPKKVLTIFDAADEA